MRLIYLAWIFNAILIDEFACQYVYKNEGRFSPLPDHDSLTKDQVRTPRQYDDARMDVMYSTSEFRESCPDSATGDFPYSGDCRKYLSCWRGRGVLRLCSPGTLFNPRTLECDFPNKVSCHTHHKRSGRSEGSHWHANPTNFIFNSDGEKPQNQVKNGHQNPNYHNHGPHQSYFHHHHHHNHNHPPGFYSQDSGRNWHSHHHHEHHTHGYNGVPTYTPYDRRYHGASKSRTNHSGVQPPVGEVWNSRPRTQFPSAPGTIQDSILMNCSRVIPVYELAPDLTPPSSNNGTDCNPAPQASSSSTGVRTFPPRYPSRPSFPSPPVPNILPQNRRSDQEYSQSSPADGSQVLEKSSDLQPPDQNFQTDEIPFCDEINTSKSAPDLTASGSTRHSRLIQPPPLLCPAGFSGLAPHLDCTKFLSCASGRTFVMDCAPGTRFNPTKLICDYPHKVRCAYENTYDLDQAGSSIVETHQQIKSDVRPTQSYDYNIDVRMGDGNVRCKLRKPLSPTVDASFRNPSTSSNPDYQSGRFSPNNNPSHQNRPPYNEPPRQTPPNYGNPTQESYPGFGDRTRVYRPVYSSSTFNQSEPANTNQTPYNNPQSQARPIYNTNSPDNRPSYNIQTTTYRPIYEDSSLYSSPNSNRPNYNNPNLNPPVYSNPNQNPPVYNNPNQSPPVYSNPNQNPPVYNNPNQSPPVYSNPPPRQNQPNYDNNQPTPDRPYESSPPRQFGPNFIDSPPSQYGPNYKDLSGKDSPKYYVPPSTPPTTTQYIPVYNRELGGFQLRFGDPDGQESIPVENQYQSIQNQFEVITARPVVVTGKSVRTKPTTTQTTTAPPTKQHVFRPDVVISTRNNKTKETPAGWQILRLRGGPSPIEGFVEIQITFGAWGILCDQRNQWSLDEANIVCKNLGYSRGADQSWQGKPADGRMSKASVIAANNVRCVGHEDSILECYISGGGSCDVDKDAVWVRCHPNSISACQPGETSFDGKCYSLVVPRPDEDTSVGFSQGEALAHCRSIGARLVDVNSQQENDYLSEWLTFPNNVDSIMTSGVGVSVMGHALWIWEGSEDSFSYNNWWPGWGGSSKGTGPKLDSGRALCVVARRYFPCASYQVATGGRSNSSEPLLCDAEYFFWDVEDCGAMTSSHPYICERPADKVGCVLGNGESYSGPANVTNKGIACQYWESQQVLDLLQYKISEETYKKSLTGHNSCRNPGGDEPLPWCFADTPNGLRKQLCDIPKCGKGVQQKSANLAEYVCQADEFSCNFNSECIPSAWVCDGQKDCGNGIDENDCGKILNKFTKLAGKKLLGHDSEKWRQTSVSDCAHRCIDATSFQCRSFSHSEKTMECVLSDSNIGLSGSLSGNDTTWDYFELNSLTIHCTQHFLCDNGKCISPEVACNGHNDCGDKSDEKNCSWAGYDIQIRLTGDEKPERGTVEVKFKGKWGLVCDDEFDVEDAVVICRQLGFSDVSDILKHSVGLSNPNNLTTYLLDNLHCLGNESNIAYCEHNGWGVHDCAPTESVGLVCTNGNSGGNSVEDNSGVVASSMWRCETSDELIHIDFLCDNVPDCTDKSDEAMSRCKSPIEVRLVGVSRSSRPEGRLEVRRFGVWGTVCDDDFGSAEAQVVCAALGHKGPARSYKNAKFGPGTGVIWLDSVHCTGNETGVERCLHEGWGKTNCKHDEDVSIICSVDVLGNGQGSSTHSTDGDTELLPDKCGTISPELDPSKPTGRFSARVVSGFETMKGHYPWQASVRLKSGGGRSAHWCGAVVIAKRYALTAGHCLRDYVKSHYFIRAGDYDTQTNEGTEQDLEVEEMWIHEELDQGARLNNDLAVVRVKPPGFNFNTWVQPACLPKGPLPKDMNCTISGWGTTGAPGSGFARTLHSAWLTPLNKEDCSSERVYGPDALSQGMFCAGSLKGGPDSCQGDSGGPFICPIRGLNTVYGITSWGHGCGRVSSPGVYTDLWFYNKWISKTLAKSVL